MKFAKSLILILVLTICVACSSTKTGRYYASKDTFSDIKAEDFILPKPVQYQESQDTYKINKPIADALIKESLSRLTNSQLSGLSQKDGGQDFLAISYCYKNDFESAWKIFDDNYNKYKQHPTYWNELGSCYYLQGNMRKALVYYNKARTLNSKYAPAVNNIGIVYLKQGNEQKALAAFKEASKLNPFALTPAFNLAQIYLKYALIDDAAIIFSALQKSNSEDQDVILGLAMVHLYKGELNNSLKYFTDLDKSTLERPEAGINFSLALAYAKKFPEAKKALSRVDTRKLENLATYYKQVDEYIRERL